MALKSSPCGFRPNATRSRLTARARQCGMAMFWPIPVEPSVARRLSILTSVCSAVGVARGIEHLLEDMRFEDAERPIGIQLYGADATVMARAATMVTEVCEPDFIDINFGCPVKKVVKNNGGSGCLKDLGLVHAI